MGKGDGTANMDINVKIAHKEIKCTGVKIAETDTQVTFPNAERKGDCLGDGIRSQGKDPTKYFMVKNSDGSLIYKSDGYPDMTLKKKTFQSAAALAGLYEGSVPFIITIDADFKGDGTTNMNINVKIARKEITCTRVKIAETDTQVTFPNAGQKGDCLGDGIRSQGKD